MKKHIPLLLLFLAILQIDRNYNNALYGIALIMKKMYNYQLLVFGKHNKIIIFYNNIGIKQVKIYAAARLQKTAERTSNFSVRSLSPNAQHNC